MSAPATRGGLWCGDRISVTGDHLSFDGDCGVRPSRARPKAGDPTWVYGPSLSSTSPRTLLSARAGHTLCGSCAGGRLVHARPGVRAVRQRLWLISAFDTTDIT